MLVSIIKRLVYMGTNVLIISDFNADKRTYSSNNTPRRTPNSCSGPVFLSRGDLTGLRPASFRQAFGQDKAGFFGDENGQPINNGKGEAIEGNPFLDAIDFHEWDYS